jgi:hypothetical protein
MFDALLKTTPDVATGAVDKVLTELRKCDFGAWRDGVVHVRGPFVDSGLPAPEEKLADKLAQEIFQEIEAKKKKRLADLTEKQLKHMTYSLSRTLEKVHAADPLYDKKAAQAILEDLKREYAFPANSNPGALRTLLT